MRCKVGDLAVVVRAAVPENLGALVEVIEKGFKCDWRIQSLRPLRRSISLFTRRITPHMPYEILECYDNQLRPIRDSEGEDETIRIAGLPREVAHG